MKTLLITLLTIFLGACVSTPRTPASGPAGKSSAGQIPASMACPGSLDPSQGCPSPTAPTPTATTPGSRQQSLLPPKAVARAKVGQSISGRCEMVMEGSKEVFPCTAVKLVLSSKTSADTREGLVDGFNVKFLDLTEDKYTLTATSETYDVTTNVGELTAGKAAKIKLNATKR